MKCTENATTPATKPKRTMTQSTGTTSTTPIARSSGSNPVSIWPRAATNVELDQAEQESDEANHATPPR